MPTRSPSSRGAPPRKNAATPSLLPSPPSPHTTSSIPPSLRPDRARDSRARKKKRKKEREEARERERGADLNADGIGDSVTVGGPEPPADERVHVLCVLPRPAPSTRQRSAAEPASNCLRAWEQCVDTWQQRGRGGQRREHKGQSRGRAWAEADRGAAH
eukprot:1817394-Rhodomonas_salina.2